MADHFLFPRRGLRRQGPHRQSSRRDAKSWSRTNCGKQGLTPGLRRRRAEKKSFELKLPELRSGRRRDVLFFTQELSTLLNAGVPLDRALSITGELTERPAFRFIVLDVLRVLKGGKSLADSLATHPDYFSDLYINMVRAGEASGSLAAIFERLAEFERTRDDLRNYIISSMIYPGAAGAGRAWRRSCCC